VHLITTAFERERVRDTFSRFVPENVVEETLQRTDDDLRLGGVERQATVMFTDLRGFTSFAESMGPDQVIEVLNQYLSDMSDAILDHGGTLVAYMGDGIMAVFGAPIEQEDHADRALSAAREMLFVRLERFNDWLRARGLSEDGFRMGIGLNSGQVMSGNVGSARRLEYTAIGDTTNTASRIEGMTKGTPHQLFVADSTREALTDPPEDLVFVDEFEVRGREARIKLWSLVSSQPRVPAQTAPGSETSGRPPL
jgi:adenylate cyclase